MPNRTGNQQICMDGLSTLLHATDAELYVGYRILIKTGTVIFNRQVKITMRKLKGYIHLRGIGVLVYVVECFLCHAIDRNLHFFFYNDFRIADV